jgi:stage V sporulation protein AF
MEVHEAGKRSRTDIAICYLQNKADMKTVKMLRNKIEKIDVNTLSMSQESLVECFIKKQHLNPFPKVRYTERPDSAAACIAEGSIIILVDNSPAAMIVPTSFFEFLQDTNDYYFPPLTGCYLRLIRHATFLLSLILTPTWLLLLQNAELLPSFLEFIIPEKMGKLPIFLQLILCELAIDGLKLASMNTPNMLSNSLSVIGGLILGDFAVEIGWLSGEVIFYSAVVAITGFSQQNYELGYAFKFLRMLLLISTALFGIYGYAIGLLVVPVLLVTNKTANGEYSYLYPLIPFNGKALLRLYFRVRKNDFEDKNEKKLKK